MININTLNATHLDFFKEMENIGASHAATALASLLGYPISLRVPSVKFYDFGEIAGMVGGPENLVVSTLVEMTGDLTGFILLIQDAHDARELANAIIVSMGVELDETDELLSEMQLSSLTEVSNILSASYMAAVGALTGLSVKQSVPRIVIDMAGAVMNLPAVTYGEYGDVVLLMQTEFIDAAGNKNLNGHFLMVPDVHSFAKLLTTMGIE